MTRYQLKNENLLFDQHWITIDHLPSLLIKTINGFKIRLAIHSIPINEPTYTIPPLGDHDIFIALPCAGDELSG